MKWSTKPMLAFRPAAWVGPVLAVLAVCPLGAQRVAHRFDLADSSTKISFDHNSQSTDFRVSPNIVFSPEGSRTYVSAPGSAKVLVLETSTGSLLDTVDVAANPIYLTLTPDGKTLAAVSPEFAKKAPGARPSGVVSLISLSDLNVRTVKFSRTIDFGFGSNVVTSRDGAHGFISSTGTDEVVRFSLASAEETGRLKLSGGSRPTVLTMAHGGDFFAVVTVGNFFSTGPDSVVVVNTADLSVRSTFAPKGDPKVVERQHNFLFSTNVAFSADDKIAAISDRIFTEPPLAGTAFLVQNDVYLFDPSSGTELKKLPVGNSPNFITLTPDGRHFIVVTQFHLTYIDVAEQKVIKEMQTPSAQGYENSSRVVFSRDGKKGYVASPEGDRVFVFDVANLFVENEVAVGKDPEVEDTPLDIAVTPAGDLVAVLNFQTNTIDYLRDNFLSFVAHLLSNDKFYTGIALANLGSSPARTLLTGLSALGVVFSDDAQTADRVEFVNPIERVIEPGTQFATTVDQLFTADTITDKVEGSVRIDSDVDGLRGFFLILSRDGQKMDGGVISPIEPATFEMIFPEVKVKDGFTTQIVVFNPTAANSPLTVQFVAPDGTVTNAAGSPFTLFGGAQFSRDVKELFPDAEKVDGGYVLVKAEINILGYQRFEDEKRLALLSGQPPAAGDPTPTTFYLPHFVVFGGYQSFLNLINPSDRTANYKVSLHAADGAVIGEPVTIEVEKTKQVRFDLAEKFQLEDKGVLAGWVEIESSEQSLVGNLELRAFDGRAVTATPLSRAGLRRVVFAHLADGLGFVTGLALLNHTQQPAAVALKVFDPQGQQTATATLALAPGERVARLLGEVIAGLAPQVGGYVTVESDQELIALELFYTTDLESLSAVLPTPLP